MKKRFLLAWCCLTLAACLWTACSSRPASLTSIADQTPQVQAVRPGTQLTQPTGWTDVFTLAARDLQGDNLTIQWSLSGSSSPNGTLTKISDTQYEYRAPINPGNTDTILITISDAKLTTFVTTSVTIPNPSDPASPDRLTLSGSLGSSALQWNSNTESDLSGYVVLRATQDQGPFEAIATVPTVSAYYIDVSSNFGSGSYYYAVQAYDSDHVTGNYSSRPSHTPASLYSDSNTPLAPSLQSSSRGEKSLTFNVLDNGDADGSGQVWALEVWQSSGGNPYELYAVTSNFSAGSNFTYAFNNLSNAVTYNYDVVAVDLAAKRNTLNIALQPNDEVPAAPTGLTISAVVGGLELDWSDNREGDLAGYWVYRTTTANSEVTTENAVTVNSTMLTSSSYRDTQVSSNQSYHYRIKAADTDGDPTALLSDFSANATYTAPEVYTQIDEIGRQGSSLGEFSTPQGIGIDSNGRVYITDYLNSRIQVLESNGTPVTSISGSLLRPANIAVKTVTSNIWVLATDQLGTNQRKIKKYLSENNALNLQQEFGDSGTSANELIEAFGIGFNSSYVYATDVDATVQGKVVRYDFNDVSTNIGFGSSSDTKVYAPLSNPRDVEIDSNGVVFVVETSKHRVLALDAAGNYQSHFGSYGTATNNIGDSDLNIYFNQPQDMAIYEDGVDRFFFIADTKNHRIVKCKQVGTSVQFITSFGYYGSSSNQLNNPTGVAISPGGLKIYVVDQGNNRIIVFQN